MKSYKTNSKTTKSRELTLSPKRRQVACPKESHPNNKYKEFLITMASMSQVITKIRPTTEEIESPQNRERRFRGFEVEYREINISSERDVSSRRTENSEYAVNKGSLFTSQKQLVSLADEDEDIDMDIADEDYDYDLDFCDESLHRKSTRIILKKEERQNAHIKNKMKKMAFLDENQATPSPQGPSFISGAKVLSSGYQKDLSFFDSKGRHLPLNMEKILRSEGDHISEDGLEDFEQDERLRADGCIESWISGSSEGSSRVSYTSLDDADEVLNSRISEVPKYTSPVILKSGLETPCCELSDDAMDEGSIFSGGINSLTKFKNKFPSVQETKKKAEN